MKKILKFLLIVIISIAAIALLNKICKNGCCSLSNKKSKNENKKKKHCFWFQK